MKLDRLELNHWQHQLFFFLFTYSMTTCLLVAMCPRKPMALVIRGGHPKGQEKAVIGDQHRDGLFSCAACALRGEPTLSAQLTYEIANGVTRAENVEAV